MSIGVVGWRSPSDPVRSSRSRFGLPRVKSRDVKQRCWGVGVFAGRSCGWGLVFVVVVLSIVVQPCRAFASANLNWAAGVEAGLPADAGGSPEVRLGSVSCGSAGDCAAVGGYVDGSNGSQGLLLSETAGVWAAGTQAGLPANASTVPSVDLTSVSCASAGECAGVGSYLNSSGDFQGLLLSESAGAWTPGIQAELPADAAADSGVDLGSVSCASAGNCAAVGAYDDRDRKSVV